MFALVIPCLPPDRADWSWAQYRKRNTTRSTP